MTPDRSAGPEAREGTAGPRPRLLGLRRAFALLLALMVAWWWLAPRDVAALILRQRDVLMGRYREDSFLIMLFLSPLLLATAWLLARRLPLGVVVGRLAMLIVSLTLSLWVVEKVAETRPRTARYIERQAQGFADWPAERVSGVVRTRPANKVYDVRYRDAPERAGTYPDPPTGYPFSESRLTTDKRGFRNLRELDRCDVLVLGDSFAEGAMVSDDEAWPAVLERSLGRTVYNLALSGSSPGTYVANFLEHGLDLQPEVVLCMLYEGNDFKEHSSNRTTTAVRQGYVDFRTRLGQMRIVNEWRHLCRDLFGGFAPPDSVRRHPAMAWMPVPTGPDGDVYYSFAPKRLMRLYWDRDELLADKGWKDTVEDCEALIAACEERDIELVFVYAPSKPRVVLPLVRDVMPAEALHAFCATREDDLPPAEEFAALVHERIDTLEATFAEFCAGRGIGFISPTEALRDRAAAGEQVYFTYDSHWTPEGNAIVADVVAEALGRRLAATSAATPAAPSAGR